MGKEEAKTLLNVLGDDKTVEGTPFKDENSECRILGDYFVRS
jgi:hypothetical protein